MSSDPDAPTMVVNLSGVALSEVETNLLSKRLSFCPTPHCMKREEILDDLENFFRRILPTELFSEKEAEEESDAQTLFPVFSLGIYQRALFPLGLLICPLG